MEEVEVRKECTKPTTDRVDRITTQDIIHLQQAPVVDTMATGNTTSDIN